MHYKIKEILWRIGMSFLLAVALLALPHQTVEVQASVRDNAYDFYSNYGNEAVFLANSQTDGTIYCGTKGVIASSGIRYYTLGWRMTVLDGSGNYLQTIYYALGGSYISKVSTVTDGPYEYNLYGIRLGDVKGCMNGTARSALSSGNCRIVLDACMTTKSGSHINGSMNDGGGFSGAVYTDYNGIASAAGWTGASKEELHTYFDKSVRGLFCRISVGGDYGIAATYGGGTYCYGTYIEVSAVPREGYLFSYWSGSGAGSARYGFYVTGDQSLYAVSRPKETVVSYWRNQEATDDVRQNVSYVYDRSGQTFGQGLNWKWRGHHIEGFSRERGGSKQYALGQGVSNRFILDYYPSTTLYTLWDINHYRIVFDGNGATGGQMEDVACIFTDVLTLPENGYEKTDAPCTFVGWSLSPESLREEYKVGEELPMESLAERTNLLYENGTITLYAIWDFAPEILTGDLYYSYKDGLGGVITPEEMKSYVRCPDREDGVLPLSMEQELGRDEAGLTYGYWYFKEYDSGAWERVIEEAQREGLDEAEVALHLVAHDHAGNETVRDIQVHLVDTTVHLGMDAYGRVRFINKKYLHDGAGLRDANSGGLESHSVWRLRDDYRSLLEAVVSEG